MEKIQVKHEWPVAVKVAQKVPTNHNLREKTLKQPNTKFFPLFQWSEQQTAQL